MSDVDVARAAARVRAGIDGRHLLLLLDFDGTLCGFKTDPAAVWLSGPVWDLLRALAQRPDVSLGIVSGRRLADVRERAGVPDSVYVAGVHGLEIEGPDERFVHSEAAVTPSAVQQAGALLQQDLARIPGAFVEDKAFSVVAHYRGVAPADVARVRDLVEARSKPHVDAGRVRVMHGACAIELLPAIDWNKGSAVEWIRQRVAARHGAPWTVYIGDDVTDEDAFRAVRGSGVAIAASTRASGADLAIDGPGDVEALLGELLECSVRL